MTPATATDTRSLVDGTVRDFRSCWKALVLTDVVFKVIAFVVLTPLVGCLFRGLLATSGRAVLTDLDILSFFLGPAGWFCFIVVAALCVGITALEHASLMAILCATRANQRLGILGALQFASANAWPVIQVTARLVAWTLLAVAPFLAIAAVTYFTLLTQYDINYYLKERPPVFGVALAIGGVLTVALVALLLRLFTGWFFAVPLVLFEGVSPSSALRVSRERAHGRRRTLLYWLVGWVLATTVFSALATGLVGLLGHVLVPGSTGSLQLLAVAIGATLIVWAVVGLAVNLLSTTTLAAILYSLYRQYGSDGSTMTSPLDVAERAADASHFRMTPKRLLAAGIVGVVLAAAIGILAMRNVRPQDRVKIMAHRGSSKAAPENTLAAIRQAIEDGADWVEIDVQETADGEVVVFHDSDFMKVAEVGLKIWDATMDDLKDLDIGSGFAPEFKDQRVPTLAQVLDECKGRIGVNIELKYYGHDEQLEQRVVDLVESREMASEVMLMSLEADRVRKLKSMRPNWKVGLLMSVAAGRLNEIEADFLAVNAGFAPRSLIRRAHDNGKEVYVWTVNDAPTMSAVMSRGVNGLLTDKPALARSVLSQRAGMSAPERLLLELSGLLGATPEFGEP